MSRPTLAERKAKQLVDRWLDYQEPFPKSPDAVQIRIRPLRQRKGFLVERDLDRLRALIAEALAP